MKKRGFLFFLSLGAASLALLSNARADEFTSEELDIDLGWQGAAVSAKFGSSNAKQDYDGVIESYTGQIPCFIVDVGDTACSSGSVAANVVGSGNGSVKSSTTLYYHTSWQNNMGTGSQSLKPFVVQGTGTVSTSVNLSIDGLMVLKEESANAANWVSTDIGYLGAIQQYNSATQEREDVDSFDGQALIKQVGGGAVTISVPETFSTDDFPDEINQNAWYNNSDLHIMKVVNVVADPTTEVALATLPDNGTRADASTYLGDGKTVYYLTYTETITFNATAGRTYYVYMDLATAADASAGNFEETFAMADFTHTIGYNISSGGSPVLTSLLLGGNQSVGSTNAFGGADTVVQLENATLTFTADNKTLNEAFNLASGTTNTFNTGANTATLAGTLSGAGGLNKTGAGLLVITDGSNTYTGGTFVEEGTLQLGGNNALPAASALRVGAGASLDMDGNNQTVSGVLSGNGTIEGGGALTASGIVRPGASIGTLTVDATAYTQATGSQLEIEFDDTGSSDLITVANGGTLTVQNGVTLVPVAMEGVTAPRTYTFMHDPAGITGTFEELDDNYAVLDFSMAKANGDQDYQLTVTRSSYASAQTAAAGRGVATTLDSVLAAGSVPAALQSVMDSLDTMSAAQINEAYDGLAPDSSGGAVLTANAATGQMQNIIGGRTDSLRTGFSSGNMAMSGAAWMQGFLTKANQEDRSGYAGYEADLRGLALGFDGDATDDLRIGLSYGYGAMSSKSDDSLTKADSHMMTVYGTYAPQDYYVDGMMSYGHFLYDSTRRTVAGMADGAYDGHQFAARADIGKPIGTFGRAVLAPMASLRYVFLHLDGYDETGAAGANLSIKSREDSTLTGGLGAKLSGELVEQDGWTWAGRIGALYTYDMVQGEATQVSRFVAGGPSFATDGLVPSRHAGEYGAGVTMSNGEGLDLSFDYNGQVRQDYFSHTGFLKVRQDF